MKDPTPISYEELKVTWFVAGSAQVIDCSKHRFNLHRKFYSRRRMLGEYNSVCDSTRRF